MKNHWLQLHKNKGVIRADLEFIGEFPTSPVIISADQSYPGVTIEATNQQVIQWVLSPVATAYTNRSSKQRLFDGLIQIYNKGVMVESWYLTNIVVSRSNYDYSLNKCSITFTCANPSSIKSQFIKF